jgi:Uma2 family endonuclease
MDDGETGVLTRHPCEPRPDFAVLRPKPDKYRSATPRPADVLLLVEVADSSLRYDRNVKLPLYARHGIPEAWIVDIGAGVVEVHRAPAGEAYTSTSRFGREATIVPESLPDVGIPGARILG